MEEEVYGIEKEHAHPKAIELVPEEFFWSCADELAPFGSDEGDMALSEYRDWKKANPNKPVINCLIWTIECLSEKPVKAYNEQLLLRKTIQSQIDDDDFDDDYIHFGYFCHSYWIWTISG